MDGDAHLELPDQLALGGVLIRASTREVLGPCGMAVLEPRVMQVLMTLAAAAGEVVTRDQLVARCWGGRAVSEDAINRSIQRIRRVTNEVAGGALSIKTVHKLGYRLLVHTTPSVERAPDEVAGFEGPVSALGQVAAPARPISKRLVIGVALLPVAAAGVFWHQRNESAARLRALMDRSTVALRMGTPQSDRQGVALLEAAVRLQPGSAEAWGRLALARVHLAEISPPATAPSVVSAAQEAAYEALSRDRRQADAMSALAILPPYFGDWWNAEQRMRQVLRAHPEHLPTRDALDFMLSAVGRGREGSLDRVRMAAVAPLNATYQFKLIYAYWILGQIEKADRTADRALQLWPRHPAAWLARLWTLAFTGRHTRAMAHVQDIARRPDLPPWMIASLIAAVQALESRAPLQVARAAELATAQLLRSPSAAVNAVMILCALGEIDRAFAVAEAYLLETGPLMAAVRWRPGDPLVNDQRRRKSNMLFVPVSAPMRADPRFEGLMDRVGLTEYWARARVTPDHKAPGAI